MVALVTDDLPQKICTPMSENDHTSQGAPIIHLQPMGGIGNRMIQFMAAKAIQKRVPGSVITNVQLAEWNYPHNPQSAPPGAIKIGRAAAQKLEIEAAAQVLLTQTFGAVTLCGYAQDVENFLPPEAYEGCFVAPDEISQQVTGYDENYLVCSLRGAEILNGHAQDYQLVPVDFYRELAETTKLKLVFFGQIGDNIYINALRKAFPEAKFVPSVNKIYDFETLRKSKNVCTSVSTFAWVATYLGQNNRIFLPCLGLLNRRQARGHNFYPLADKRYQFYWFPISYAQNIADVAAFDMEQRKLSGNWRLATSEFMAKINPNGSLVTRKLEDFVRFFDEDYYVRIHPGLAERLADGTFSSGLHHYWYNGFGGAAPAFPFSPKIYCRHYADAAIDVANGIYFNFEHHYVEVGHKLGYKTFAA